MGSTMRPKTEKLASFCKEQGKTHTIRVEYRDQLNTLTERVESQGRDLIRYLKDRPMVATFLLTLLITVGLVLISD